MAQFSMFSCLTATQKNIGGIGKEVQQIIHTAAELLNSPTPCEGHSDSTCPCLDLQSYLQQLLRKAEQQKLGLDVMLEVFVHAVLTSITFGIIRHCPHVAETKLAIAEAYYK